MSLSRVCRLVNAPLVMVVWMLWGHGIAVSAERPIAGARIAVAANFRDTAEAIALHLEAHSDYHYDIIVGSTGKLASQVINGAPFDVLMAADRARPQRLVEEGYAVAGSQRTYALGELGLWWPGAVGPIAIGDLSALNPREICLANPALAPYGSAALTVLREAGFSERYLAGLVRVDNVNLVTAMVTQRQVRAGFIARSAVVIAAKRDSVQMDETEILWFSDHEPIHQALVLLDHAQHNPAAHFWVEQIDHPAVRELIRAGGYQLRPLESTGGG